MNIETVHIFHTKLLASNCYLNEKYSDALSITETFLPCEPFKGALSGLTHFLAGDSSLKIMKNAFYFTLKAYFVLKIFKFVLNFWSRRKTA